MGKVILKNSNFIIIFKRIKEFCVKKLKFQIICNHFLFEIFLFFINIGSIVIVIVEHFLKDEHSLQIISTFDKIFAYLYTAEFLIKIGSYGITRYFRNRENMLI